MLKAACADYCKRLRNNDEECVEVELSCSADRVRESLSQREFDDLSAALRGNRHARSLVLWGNKDVGSVDSLLAALQDNAALEKVNLELTGVDADRREMVSRVLINRRIDRLASDPDMQRATAVDLSCAGLENRDMKRLCQVLRSNVCLSSLSLWGNKGLTNGRLVEELLQAGEAMPLVQISLDDTGVGEDGAAEVEKVLAGRRMRRSLTLLEANESGRVLNLAHSGLGDASLAAVGAALARNTSTASLSIGGNPDLTRPALLALLSALSASPECQLSHISADPGQFDAAAAARLRAWRLGAVVRLLERASPSLTSVDLSRMDLTNKELEGTLFPAIARSPHVAAVSLARNKLVTDECLRGEGGLLRLVEGHGALCKVATNGTGLSDMGGSMLTNALKARGMRRAVARISGGGGGRVDWLRGVGVDDADVKALSEALRAGDGAFEIDLGGNNRVSDRSVDTLMASVRKGRAKVTRLALDGTSVTHPRRREARRETMVAAVDAACNALDGGGADLVVDLSGVGLGDEEVLRLAERLWRSTSVTGVLLSNNPMVTDASADALCDALEGHSRRNPACACHAAGGGECPVRAGRGAVSRVATDGTSMSAAGKQKLLALCKGRALARAAEELDAAWHPPMLRTRGGIRYLRAAGLTDHDVAGLSAGLAGSDMVSLVDLRDNPGVSVKSSNALISAARHNGQLHSVLVQGTRLAQDVKRARELEGVLNANALSMAQSILASGERGVTSLDFLRGRGLADGDVQALIKGLEGNKQIVRVDLSMNPAISDDGARAIQKMLLLEGKRCGLQQVDVDGTGVGWRTRAALQDVLKQRKEDSHVEEEKKEKVGAVEGDVMALATVGAMEGRWKEVEGGLKSVSAACTRASSSLELGLRKVLLYKGSHEGLRPSQEEDEEPQGEVSVLEPPKGVFGTPQLVQLGEGEEIVGLEGPGGLENPESAIGVRVKMEWCPASYREDMFHLDVCRSLSLRSGFVEIVPRSDETIQDLNLAADPSDPLSRTSELLAAQLFALCEDRRSDLCSRYNQGREMFCHYPWATARASAAASRRMKRGGGLGTGNLDSQSPLEMVILRLDRGTSTAVSKRFARLCSDMKGILDKLGVASSVEGACAQAMGKLEPLVTGLASLKPFHEPPSEELRVSQRLCDDYMEKVSSHQKWTDQVQSDEVEARERLLSHWGEVRGRRVAIQDWANFLQRFESDVGGGEDGQSLQLSMARRDASGVIDALKKWLGAEKKDKERRLDKYRQSEEARKERRERLMGRLKERREELQERIKDIGARREECLQDMLRRLEEYEDLSEQLLRVAGEDQRHLTTQHAVEKEARKDKEAVGSDDLQSGALVKRLEKGLGASDELKIKVKTAIEEIESSLRREKAAWFQADQTLTCNIYNGLFCRLYALVLLVASRHQVSIEMDETELKRIEANSLAMDVVGKRDKLSQAKGIWHDGAVPPRGGEVVQLADRGLDSQQSSLVRLVNLGGQLQMECEPVWECMSRMPHATRICEGSDAELIVLWSREQGSSVQFEDLPHPRALLKRVTFKDLMPDTEGFKGDRSSMGAYLGTIVKAVLRDCAISDRFKVEYKHASAAARRAEDALNKAEASESGTRSRREEARRATRRDTQEAQRKALELKKEDENMRLATEEAKEAEEKAELSQEELDQCKENILESKKRLEEAQKALEKAKEVLDTAEKKAKVAEKEVKVALKAAEVKKEQLSRASEAHDVKRKAAEYAEGQRSKSLGVEEGLDQEVRRLSEEVVRDTKERCERTRIVLDAYNHVRDMTGDVGDMFGGGGGYLIELPPLGVMVRFVVDERYDVVCPSGDARRKEEFKRSFKKSLLYIMRNRNGDAAPDDRTARVSEVDRHVSGAVTVIVQMGEPNDRAHPIRKQIDVLRADFFPLSKKVAPAKLSTGQGRLSRIISIEVLDPIGRGHIGDVRVARLGRDMVVVKFIRLGTGQNVQGWQERVRRGLLSQFPALASLSHPNVLSYRAVCADDTPVLALVQDYCYSNLSKFLAQHSSSHHPKLTLSEKDIDDVFNALDVNANGQVHYETFFRGLKEHEWIATKLGLLTCSLEERLEVFHKIARDGGLSIDQEGLARYYGRRELPGTEVSWAQRIQVAVSVARGLEYLTSHGLVHGNLKSANVAIVEGGGDAGGASGTWLGARIAVMDFGVPHLCKTGDFPVKGVSKASGPWQAPEVHKGGEPTLQADVWSLGVVLWEVLTGEVPWAGKSREQLAALIGREGRTPPVQADARAGAPLGFVEAMEKCWAVEPSERPSVTRVISMVLGRWSEWPDEFLPG